MKRHPSIPNLLALATRLALGPGCMSDPDDYVDPPPAPAVDASTTPDDAPSGDDTAPAADVVTTDDTAADPQDGGPSDAAPAPGDTAPQEVAQPDEVIEPSEEDVPSGPTCPCSFQLAATQPMAQDYVWITGDFLDPA
ncbi:MAG: hypothetical protein VX938_04000, partial [Myxococcota bacterium]|nr:hypothetical protein [Myxococcota bacterium]